VPANAKIPVYLEVGKKRVFACALDWPGWCRSGKDDEEALETFLGYGARYAKAFGKLAGFKLPSADAEARVVERMRGDATTDFGALSVTPSSDKKPLKDPELRRLTTILQRCWTTFDNTAEKNKRRTLRSGPRGGGRDVGKMIEHVLEADRAYLSRIGGTSGTRSSKGEIEGVRAAILETLAARAQGVPPPPNPRRTKELWTPRFAIRRSAWHALDHAWEIEDRLT
jgi:hypothetical protein